MIQVLLSLIVLCSHSAVEETKPAPMSLSGIKCIVSGKQANKKYSARFKQGKVFFDCNDSRLAYESDKRTFHTRANHQLVITGQYVQSKCPITKAKVPKDSNENASIAGVNLKFCCQKCKNTFLGKNETPQDRIAAVFDQNNFASLFLPRPKSAKRSQTSAGK